MNFGFVSTRFSGTDGVSLEAQKWADVLASRGHNCFWFSGQNDRPTDISAVVPEAFFESPKIVALNEAIWGKESIPETIAESIEILSNQLKNELRNFCARFKIDVLIPQNALAIPMNLPLGLALTEFIEETALPTIAHHHDFAWERERFSGSAAKTYLDRAFPPSLPSIAHVVINSEAGRTLESQKSLPSTLIPNVMDFDEHLPSRDDDTGDLRKDLGFKESDILFLQPTRIVPRKGIEHAIKLVSELSDPNIKLIISHDAGDEGFDYQNTLLALADELSVDLRLLGPRISSQRQQNPSGEKCYTLWDLYPVVDFITYPSLYEGFGNALLETVYFKKPALVNRYPVYIDDIEPFGFDFVLMDGQVTKEVTSAVSKLLNSPEQIQEQTNRNFSLASKHFGYDRVASELDAILKHFSL